MARHRQGVWSGPECPECGAETTHAGVHDAPDDTYDVFLCPGGRHSLRVPQNRLDGVAADPT